MAHDSTDVAIVGGGLSGGLIALELLRTTPQLSIRLIEAGEELGGNHRWSWFASDMARPGSDLLAEFPCAEWGAGYEVCFPKYRRKLVSSYRSLSSMDFAATLHRRLNQGSITTGQNVATMTRNGVALANGDTIAARTVIDCRGFSAAPPLHGGWQVFLGQTIRCNQPHGQDQPIIMDASVEQLGGYRFVYVLPLDEQRVFIEDTYYQDTPTLDADALRGRIAAYAQAQRWNGTILHEETGLLPVITGGDFDAFQAAHRAPGLAVAGARGGFVHPLTSYTMPVAVRIAQVVADSFANGRQDDLPSTLESEARRHWRNTGFYRLLGQMLFGAARPHDRYRIFERFYKLRQPLIERFYAGRSTLADKARILAGKPPVPILAAMGALATQRPPLAAHTSTPPPLRSQKAA